MCFSIAPYILTNVRIDGAMEKQAKQLIVKCPHCSMNDERTSICLLWPLLASQIFFCRLSLDAACEFCWISFYQDGTRSRACCCALQHFTSLKSTCCAVYFRLNKMPSVVDNGFIADFWQDWLRLCWWSCLISQATLSEHVPRARFCF